MLFPFKIQQDQYLESQFFGIDFTGTVKIDVLSLMDNIAQITSFIFNPDFSASTKSTSIIKLPNAPIIHISYGTTSGLLQLGQMQVRATLNTRSTGSNQPLFDLGSGYFSNQKGLMLNGSNDTFVGIIEPWPRIINPTIAAGDNFVHEFEDRGANRIESIHFDFVTAAGGVARVPFVQIDDVSGNMLYKRLTALSITASQTEEVNAVTNIPDSDITDKVVTVQLPAVRFPTKGTITLGFENIAGGDQISNAFMCVVSDIGHR